MTQHHCAIIRKAQSNNELTHWKYIKKVKKNGKWRYYYDKESRIKDMKNKLGYDEAEKVKNAGLRKAKATKKLIEAENNLKKYNDGRLRQDFDSEGNLISNDKYTKEYILAKDTHTKMGEQYIKAKKELYKTPIGLVNRFMKNLNKSIAFVDKIVFGKD